MITLHAVSFTCDLCAFTADGPLITSTPAATVKDPPMPAGWVNLAHLQLTGRDFYCAPVNHLCGPCASLPIREVLSRLAAEIAEREKS